MREGEPPRDNGYAVSRDLTVKPVLVAGLTHLGRETRKHSRQQVGKVVRSLSEYGFVLPILIDPFGRVVAGWGLVLAARRMGLKEISAITVTDLSEAKLRTLRQMLNRVGEEAQRDPQELRVEFQQILELDASIDLTLSGFEMGEIDVALRGTGLEEEDELPEEDEARVPVSELGVMWLCGDHRVLCGDARDETAYERLMGGDTAEMGFTDSPFNLPIDGHVSGLGKVKHPDFAMASGEMSPAEFTAFLLSAFRLMAKHSVDGSVHFAAMDFRHMREILAAGDQVPFELLNLCVWTKTAAGMGSQYRGAHELFFVFKSGKRSHVNNVMLGKYGRWRSNVWNYVSQNGMGRSSKSKLGLHPTSKPVALVADAILDCSNRGGVVLDPFGGAGSTLIAAEKTGRKARLIEIEPRYVDVTVERWQRLTGQRAVNAETGAAFGG